MTFRKQPSLTFDHQDVGDFARRLPRRMSEFGLYYAVRPGESVHQKISIRPLLLRNALTWLRDNNGLYKNIVIDEDVLEELSAQQAVPTVAVTDDNARPEVPLQTFVFDEAAGDSSAAQLDATVQELLAQTDETIITGAQRGTPVDERRELLFAASFPELFPTGKGDFTDTRPYALKLSEYAKHRMHLSDLDSVGILNFCFRCLMWCNGTGSLSGVDCG